MPSPRQNLRGRRQTWNERQLAQLWHGHDYPMFGGEHDVAWGDLTKLSDEQLREAIDEMQACWDANRDRITAEYLGENPVFRNEPWFAKYGTPEGNARLFAECHQRREFMAYQHQTGGFRPGCYDEFLKSYVEPTPPEPASAAAE
jgi:hypothetical protein